jgi:hypothetical protein
VEPLANGWACFLMVFITLFRRKILAKISLPFMDTTSPIIPCEAMIAQEK